MHHPASDADSQLDTDLRGRSTVGRRLTYTEELALLETTFRLAMNADVSALRAACEQLTGRNGLYVASGGALAVARLAADLHEFYGGGISKSLTPLALSGSPPLLDAGIVMFSARGRHPDARSTVESALSGDFRPAVLLTLRSPEDLPVWLRSPHISVVTVPSASSRDGFLATNSLLGMSCLMVRAFSNAPFPAELSLDRAAPRVGTLRDNLLVLTGPGLECVAIDLETRFAETGLASVQVCDYRNLAHGRHVGLQRRLDSTSIVALIARPFRAVAEETLALLPAQTHVVRLESQLEWPMCAIELLCSSMKIVAEKASSQRRQVARPQVPQFGRRLYHLKVSAIDRRLIGHAVRRKILAARVPVTPPRIHHYSDAFDSWMTSLGQTVFGAVVLDYDGTCCFTDQRYHPPPSGITKEILRLLDLGATLGFASGRGDSLRELLRSCIPASAWRRVIVGLNNGARIATLDQDVFEEHVDDSVLAAATTRLGEAFSGDEVEVRSTPFQVSIRVAPQSSRTIPSLADEIAAMLARPPALGLTLVTSGHSVDVVSPGASKAAVVDKLRSVVDGEVLVIGDQGQLGGNDFFLLASSPYSASVDRCSPDATRCWAIARPEERGPLAAQRILNAARSTHGGLQLNLETL